MGAEKPGRAGNECSLCQDSVLRKRELKLKSDARRGKFSPTLNNVEELRSSRQFARLAFLRLVARLPANAHVSKAMALHLVRLIQIAAVDDDRKTQGAIQSRQIDRGKLLPVRQDQ